MKRDQLIKFIIAQRIKMYEKNQSYKYEERIDELQAVIEMIDGLVRLEEEDDMQAISLDQFLDMLGNFKDNEDTNEDSEE